MKRIHLLAILAGLALAVGSCGGSDAKKETSTPVAGTSTTEPSEQAQGDSPPSSEPNPASSKNSKQNGDGGSSATDAERAAATGQGTTPAKSGSGAAPKKRKPKKAQTPDEQIASLSPSERRALHKDLYEQGKKLCYAYGPKELAKSYNLTGSSPETIAQQFARAYEAAAPTLILPYQQGCLVGFKRFARNPPEN